MVFFSYFFVSAAVVSFDEGFNKTIMEKGYPVDFVKASWGPEEFFQWGFDWLPSFNLRYSIVEDMIDPELDLGDQEVPAEKEEQVEISCKRIIFRLCFNKKLPEDFVDKGVL